MQIKNPKRSILYCPDSRTGIFRSASLPKTIAGNKKTIKSDNDCFIPLELE
jgi:hypothetical protein